MDEVMLFVIEILFILYLDKSLQKDKDLTIFRKNFTTINYYDDMFITMITFIKFLIQLA